MRGSGSTACARLRAVALPRGALCQTVPMPDATTTTDVLHVVLPVPLPQGFDYLPPAGGAATPDWIGCRVRVPFGHGERIGIVSACRPAQAEAGALKPILARLDPVPLLDGELRQTLERLARYLHAPLGAVLATALPAALRRGEALPDTQVRGWALTAAGHAALPRLRAGKPRTLAERLAAHPALGEATLDDTHRGWRGAMRALAARGLVEVIALDADPLAASPAPVPGPALHADQATAVAAITSRDDFAPWLLAGVTGSGKTEVYLHAIEACLARGRQALVLVPEIGLTPQTLHRFRARLGLPVHALHSGLTDGERARTWLAAARGQARVIVGTRSAVFTPLPEAGLIVVDEEHDASYKQQDGIRYHARDVALLRAQALGVPIVLGSATPALETLHNADSGRFTRLRLPARAGSAKPPQVEVLDVRQRPLDGGLAPESLAAIARTLADGGQVLVFRNRRGYAPALLCHDCGWTAACRHCDAPLTVHGAGRRLQCHHCGARQSVPLACPACASLALHPQGIGTEQLEDRLIALFPEVPVLRVDSASTRQRDGLARQFARLGQAPGLLVGTQMLAKGHDLPGLALVVVVGVDEGLFSTDFRAGERLAQLLIQVAGRAGRAERAGRVIVQTHHPAHPLLTGLLAGGYTAFAATTLAERHAAALPPFAHLALLRAESAHAEHAPAFLQAARAQLAQHAGDGLRLHDAVPAPMPRRAGLHRWQLLLAADQRRVLHATLDAALPALYALPEARRVRWSLDVDPLDLY
jgi:primosomal protein N' (replication factor Y)